MGCPSVSSSAACLQVAHAGKNSRAEKLQRDELLRILKNLQLYNYARFFDVADSRGKDQLKEIKTKLQSSDKIRKASSNALVKLSSALNAGANWGLEEYIPSTRLLPGRALEIVDRNPSVICFTSDEGPDMKLSHSFLVSCGVRCCYERDFYHRLDNSFNLAIKHSVFEETKAKGLFLSRVNRAPYGSGANYNFKSEAMSQLHDVGRAMVMRHLLEPGLKFDRGVDFLGTENILDELIGTAESIEHKTEGVSRQCFAIFCVSKTHFFHSIPD